MSWFGETLGDSFTSLKGQIKRITKEVLIDDENASLQEKETNDLSRKELEALCESKNLEILSLKEEITKLQTQYNSQLESLKNKYDVSSDSWVWSNDEDKHNQLVQLQEEVNQLKKEKNHLDNCIDDLQLEHQKNLNEVILIKDKYKKELEDLKKEISYEKLNSTEILQTDNLTSSGLKEGKKLDENNENEFFKTQIKNLQLQVNETSQELIECKKALSNEAAISEQLKKQIENLSGCIETLKNEKSKIEEEYNDSKKKIESVCKDLEFFKKDNSNLTVQLNNLIEEKEFLNKKIIESSKSHINLVNSDEIEKKLQKILESIDFHDVENKYQGLDDIFKLIENNLNISKKNSEEKVEKLTTIVGSYEAEIKKLNDQNSYLQNDLQHRIAKWTEEERKYQNDLSEAHYKLEETTDLKLKLLEVEKQSQIHSQSQTDDVKRLEQEVNKLLHLCEMKTDEITQLKKIKTELEQELSDLKTITETVSDTFKNNELIKLTADFEELKKLQSESDEKKKKAEEECFSLSSQIVNLNNIIDKLKSDYEQIKKDFDNENNIRKKLQEDYDKAQVALTQLEKSYAQLQMVNNDLNGSFENMKAEIIVRESRITELIKFNDTLQNNIKQLEEKIRELDKNDELQKWKNVAVDLELQIQDLNSKIEILEAESFKTKVDSQLIEVKDNEILQLKESNFSLTETCKKLEKEVENKIQNDQLISDLQEANAELKTRIQKFQNQIKMQIYENEELSKAYIQQHKRSKSASTYDSTPAETTNDQNENLQKEITLLKQAVQNEKQKYDALSAKFQELSDREGNAKREFERLKQHLIEVEDHYTEQAVENEAIINELKSKLMMAEEQLSNSSTLYTSAKIRDNQHVESLQNQLRLVRVQRDDFQAKLSEAEDEIQKHKASLTNLQIVLEQFQQDKKRELEVTAAKYEKQMEATKNNFKELEKEIERLQQQLVEAKNGLQAASRLGEQLERKSQQLADFERLLTESEAKIVKLEEQLNISNQSVCGKVDKSLIKNLVAGYIVSPNSDRKSQVLRILASVLDFDQEERNKMGVDASSSGWLAGILHPKNGGPGTNESFSEAFIKFLENESRPQPQLNLLSDRFKTVKTGSNTPGDKTQKGSLSELVLPTFNTSQENESSFILKNVLKES